MAPFISDKSAKQCEKLNVGYMDMSGNYRLSICALYVHERGYSNKFIKKHVAKTIFDPSSKVSSMILREIMSDVSSPWKLSLLSEKLQGSIGQVFKVKGYLCEQRWAHMTVDGLRILDAQAIMQTWGIDYAQKDAVPEILDYYTLLSVPDFEDSVRQIRINVGIDSYLTGFAGGMRYTPVVKYNKVHLLVKGKDILEFLETSACKKVDSGSNVQIHVLSSDELLYQGK